MNDMQQQFFEAMYEEEEEYTKAMPFKDGWVELSEDIHVIQWGEE